MAIVGFLLQLFDATMASNQHGVELIGFSKFDVNIDVQVMHCRV